MSGNLTRNRSWSILKIFLVIAKSHFSSEFFQRVPSWWFWFFFLDFASSFSQYSIPSFFSHLLPEFIPLFLGFLPEFIPGFLPEVFTICFHSFLLDSSWRSNIYPKFVQEFFLDVFRVGFLTVRASGCKFLIIIKIPKLAFKQFFFLS